MRFRGLWPLRRGNYVCSSALRAGAGAGDEGVAQVVDRAFELQVALRLECCDRVGDGLVGLDADAVEVALGATDAGTSNRDVQQTARYGERATEVHATAGVP